MNDKYNTYDNQTIQYDYPYTWKKRNISYLEKHHDAKINKVKRYVTPVTVIENPSNQTTEGGNE